VRAIDLAPHHVTLSKVGGKPVDQSIAEVRHALLAVCADTPVQRERKRKSKSSFL
jgi:hypothetical protein